MSSDGTRRQPPSPPYSNQGDLGCFSDDYPPYNTHTPPGQVRITSAETYHMPYNEMLSYPPLPQTAYYSPQPDPRSPQPVFVRKLHPTVANHRAVSARDTRSLGSPIHPHTVGQSPRSRKRKADLAQPRSHDVLPGPLSEITKDYAIPVRDMSVWVNRSVEERLDEANRKRGHIARPMNSFMLYRSAYSDRVKQYCKENNHQVVSKVTGQSWPLEPKEIRELYEQYAAQEKSNHKAAHPEYKFTPNKASKKHTQQETDGEDDTEDDSDGEWNESRSTKRYKRGRRDATRSASSTPFGTTNSRRTMIQHSPPLPHPSSYRTENTYESTAYNPVPSQYTRNPYDPDLIPYGPSLDDMRFPVVHPTSPSHRPEMGLTAMPNGHNDLLNVFADPLENSRSFEPPIDPDLGGPPTEHMYGPFSLPNNVYSIPRSYPHGPYASAQASEYAQQQLHPGMIMLAPPSEGWHHNASPGAEFSDDFSEY